MRHTQQRIIAELGVRPTINPSEEIERRTAFLANYLGASAATGYVLGISGGQDSLLAGILAQRAVRQLRSEGREAEFHAALLPYGTQADRADALLALDVIQPDAVYDIDIKPAVDASAAAYEAATGHPLPDYHRGNIKARERMIAQYALAGDYRLLVLGTDHAAEAVTGFYTKFGDGAADVLPLARLNKRQGWAMSTHLGVPNLFITKAPTADLLDARPGQPDETELGIPYDTIDDYLEGKPVDPAAAAAIEARYQATMHKRSLPVAY